MKKLSSFLLIFLLILQNGCQKQQHEVEKQMAPSQLLRINNQGDPASLHPHTGLDLSCRNFQNALFEGLTRINLEGKPECAGAEHIEISPDKKCYTFTLRPMKWTNGEPVTAAHFEEAWKEALAPNSNCLRADLFYPIKNAVKAKKGEAALDEVGIRAPDAQTLIVELEHPTPYFLNLISTPLFSPLFDKAEAPTIFNGPFSIAKWDHDRQLLLKKNPLFWDAEHVYLEEIDISLVNDPLTAWLMYEKGELDWVGHPFSNIPLDALEEASRSSDFTSHPISGVYWISLNTQSFPLNSVKIRQALSTALNRDALAHHVAMGETPTKSLVPLSLTRLAANELYPDADAKKALKLFEEGLRELHITREEFPVLRYSYSDIPGQKKLAEAIQQSWERTLGIQVDLIPSEWNVFFASLGERQYQIGGCIWFCAFNDPVYTLEFFKERANRYNAPQWESQYYQELLDLADAEPDATVRAEHLKQAERLILDEMPIIPLYMVHSKHLKSPRVQSLIVNDLGQADFRWAYVEEAIPSLSRR